MVEQRPFKPKVVGSIPTAPTMQLIDTDGLPFWFGHIFAQQARHFLCCCALLCVNRSLKLAPASTVVPYQYTMIIWAVMFGYVVFGDVPSLTMALGAVVITAAGLYIFLRERKLGKTEAMVSPPG